MLDLILSGVEATRALGAEEGHDLRLREAEAA